MQAIFLVLLVVCVMTGQGQKCTPSNQRVECGALTCDEVSRQCVACTNNSQCFESVMQCHSGECRVGSVKDTFTPETFLSLLLTILVCAVAVVAGIGGGGILVPMYSALTDMPMITAVGLSQAAICGQSALNMYFAVPKRVSMTSTQERYLINYQYLSIILPLSLGGTLLGSALSKIVPDWLRLALLFILLTTVLHRVVERARRQFRSDSLRKQENIATTVERQVELPSDGEETAPVVTMETPVFELFVIFMSFFVLLMCNVVRTKFTDCGSAEYIVFFVAPVVLLFIVAMVARAKVRQLVSLVAVGAASPEELTFQWNNKTTFVFPLVAIVAGGAASMLGIGGGLVLSFVLFEAGLPPEEASATSGFATLLIASESALQLVFQEQLVVDYASLYFVAGIASTLLGQNVFVRYIKSNSAQFLIIVALAAVVGGSLLTLTSYGIYDMVELVRHDGSLFAFGHMCKKLQ